MLYGNLIFIKKTGGDGSKFPITEREVTIGRSKDCLIRIHNTEVAQEHCQLIIKENGQTILQNLSNKTVLNGKPLAEGDVTLCHGDIFKVGERLARWEYLPTSIYYRQLLSPTGRLVAVVVPQQRSMGEQETPGTSVSQVSVLKNTLLGKRRCSERGSVKIRKSSGTDLNCKTRGDLPKFLTGRHSLKTTKLLLHGAKVKERKSISGTVRSKTPKGKFGGKSRKSTLPSWKVNVVSPLQQKSTSRNSLTKSSKKLAKSPKNAVKTPLKDLDSGSSQKLLLSVSKSGLKTPQQVIIDSESSGASTKSSAQDISKTPVKALVESPLPKSERCVMSTRSFSKSPSPKKTSPKSLSKIVLSTPKPKPPKLVRLVHSESKLNSRSGRQELFPKGSKRMRLILEKADSTPEGILKKLRESLPQEKEKVLEGIVSDSLMESRGERTSVNEAPPVKVKQTLKSVKDTSAKKILGKTSRKCLLQKALPISPTEVKGETPRKSIMKQTPDSLTQRTSRVSTLGEVALDVIVKTPLPMELNSTPSSKKAKSTPRKSAKSVPNKKTPGKLVRSVGKMKSPTSPSRKIFLRQTETISFASPLDISTQESVRRSTPPMGQQSGMKEASLKKTQSSPKSSTSSQRGVRRMLSPSSSAERAAKKLKTSSPKKPDKNKKAALLVLGKANRKQLLSQNMKVLLKQRIVKKAIKQSTALTSQKVESRVKIAAKLKKGLRKTTSKSKKKPEGKEKSSNEISVSKSSKTSDACPVKDKTQEVTLKGNVLFETSQPSTFKAQTSPTPSSKGKPTEASEPSKQDKKSESPRSINLEKSSTSVSSPDRFDKATESYLFNSNRRSKRLSSKNETCRPDFIELSPTALGLMPKNINIFKTPKGNKRRSSSLVTPKSVRSMGIIKSSSTSKIGNRKSVRFSAKDVSYNPEFQSPVIAEKVDFDFSSCHTPDITLDIFVSPLPEESSVTKKDVSESKSTSGTGDISKTSIPKVRRNSSACVRKLLQPPQVRSLSKVSPNQKMLSQSTRTAAVKSPSPSKLERKLKSFCENKSPKNDLSDLKGVRQLLGAPKAQKSPKNNLTDLKGIKKLFQTPRIQKSPKNDLTDVRGVKKLLQTPKVQKSPKNDLTDVRGVKKLMRTPKTQRSPKNDLTDVRGVKKLMRTPKTQRSPKNDLTDVRGVKKLMRTPKTQRSLKNDLTDVRGVKKLMRTPKTQKSPKNDLTDVRGIKRLMRTPKTQKSPKNDLTDVRGVKKLMRTPKTQKSPKNDLTDVRGVKKLMRTPKAQKSPKNDFTNVDGLKELLRSPRVQKCPKNDLTDVTGVKKLLTTARGKKSPKNNLLEVSGLGNIFDSPTVEKLSRNSAVDLMKVPVNSPKSERNLPGSAADITGINQLSISKSPDSVSKSKKTVSRKSHVNVYKAVRGRLTMYSTPKGPKNNLSDLTGVRELFSRHKPTSDYNVSLTGVTEIFDLPNSEVDSKPKKRKPRGKSVQSTTERKSPSKRMLESEKELGTEVKEEDKPLKRILRKATEDETRKRATRRKAAENVDEGGKPAKRKAIEKIKTSQAKKTTTEAKKTGRVTKKETKTTGKKSLARIEGGDADWVKQVVKGSRKRKALFEEVESPPVKYKRKLPATEAASSEAIETSRKVVSRSKKETVSEEKISLKGIKRDSVKEKVTKTSKSSSKAIKTSTKRVQKVQNRSQSSSKTNSSYSEPSPRKTRSAKNGESKAAQKKVSKTQTKTVGKKVAKVTAGRKNTSPIVKRSTRRKCV